MGEKETATGEEAAVVKTKTKSNQSNDRTAQDGDDGAGITDAPENEAERVLKNKTKSNQSNDRTAQDGGAGEADDGGMTDEGGRSDVSERATWSSSNPGLRSSGPRNADQGFRTAEVDGEPPSAAGDLGGAGTEQGRFYNQKTNEKGREAGGDDADDGNEAAINNSHSNIKNLRESGGGGSGSSDIAIGDPGVNGNFTDDPQGIAVSDDGGAQTPKKSILTARR